MLIVVLFFVISTQNIFAQTKISIPQFSAVYYFTNNNRVNEVFFDHHSKSYLTNSNSLQKFQSITNNTNRIFILKSQINMINLSNKKKLRRLKSFKKGWRRPHRSQYRTATLQRTYLNNTTYPFMTNKNGSVINGLWYDHFTDSYISRPYLIHVDHIVPFKEAFRSQKSPWSQTQIIAFYNSHVHSALQPTYKKENLKKKDLPPTIYLPPNKRFIHIYKDMWNHTKQIYNLYY